MNDRQISNLLVNRLIPWQLGAMSRAKPKHPRPCQVCRHEHRQRIELMRLSGLSLDIVAGKFQGVHRDALHRHMKNHLDQADKKALIDDLPMKELAARAAEEGSSVLDYLGIVRGVVMRALLGAADAGDRIGTASLSGRAVEVLKEVGRLTGEISSLMHVTNTTNNIAIFNSPQFAELESMLVDRLRDHPAALKAVIEGLQELEHKAAPEGLVAFDRRPLTAIEHQVQS